MNRRTLLAWAAAGLSLASCTSDRSAGGGDEMGNFVRVAVVDSAGNPAIGARISLRRDEGSLPGGTSPEREILTDSAGSAVLRELDRGEWTITASLGPQGRMDTITLGDRIVERRLVLGRKVRVQGILEPVAGATTGLAWIRGTGFSTSTDSVGSFAFEGVPPGPARLEGAFAGRLEAELAVELRAGRDTALGRLPIASRLWRDSLVVHLDAGSRGIATREPLFDLPVPIRLVGSGLDLSRARPDGSDLRATRADGRPIPLALEDWNPANGTGVAWILVDTLHAGRDSQTVVLRWGRSDGTNLLRPVFAGQAGWVGAWHLGTDLADGSDRGRSALDSGTSTTPGVVGLARLLRRTSRAHLSIGGGTGAEPEAMGDVTLEAWARSDAPDTGGWDAIAAHDDVGVRIQRRGKDSVLSFGVTDSLASVGDSLATWGTNGTSDIMDGAWHHVVGMRRSDSLLIFVDGRREIAEPWAKPMKRTQLPLQIGRNAGARHWDGAIDEVRMARRSFSDEWIRASWEAMRPGSRLLRW